MPIEPGIELRKEEVLKRITEEEIFEKYLQLPVDESINYINPLRVDTNPGCRYYRNNQGKLRFKDFSKGYNWDCFSLVQHIYKCSFIDALRIIVRDFKLNTEIVRYETQREFKLKERFDIKIATRAWESYDLTYWNSYNIYADTLLTYNVFPCKAIWINDEYYRCRKNDPCYAYYFGNRLYKLYFPKRKKGTTRFFTNVIITDNLLQGYLQLPDKGDILIITKSYKDVMSLHTFNLVGIAPQSESQTINKTQYNELRTRFSNIISLVDNDHTGRSFGLRHYKDFGTPIFIFPWTMEKDFSDNVKKFGIEKMRDIINIIKETEGL